MVLKKAKNLCHVIGDRGFDPRGDVLDLILEDKILLLRLRSSWARRFEMLRLSTLASERYTSIRLHEALHVRFHARISLITRGWDNIIAFAINCNISVLQYYCWTHKVLQ